MLSDADLIARVLARDDRHAFAELVRRYQSPVRALLRRLTAGDAALADDLAQETFLEAFRKMAQFAHGSFFGWLCAIAYSKFLMEARKRRFEPLEEADDMAADLPEPESASLTRIDLERAMQRLVPAQRAALTLCFALGLSHEEAAATLNLPLGTLKSHVTRGREKLSQMLGVRQAAS